MHWQKIRPYVVGLIGAVSVAVSGTAVAQPSSAINPPGTCKIFASVYTGEQYKFCVVSWLSSSGDMFHGEAYTKTLDGGAGSGPRGTIVVYAEQARGDLSGRSTIAANSAVNAADLSTSAKPTAGGHVYRACGSFEGSGVTVGPFCDIWWAVPS